MAGRLDSKVALITGAARGQGARTPCAWPRRAPTSCLLDVCQLRRRATDYPAATAEDLAETVRQVEALDRRVVWADADVRDLSALQAVVDRGVSASPP